MMRRNKRNRRGILSSLLLCMLVFTLAAPVTVFAAEPIDTGKDASLTVSYKDEGTPIVGTGFNIFRVADVDEFADMTLTAQFASYPVSVDGLDQNGWQALALTLDGYAKRDKLTAESSAVTDSEGTFTVTLKPGLFLVTGEQTVAGGYTYTPTPFMVFLPDSDEENNTWNYEVSAEVKFSKEELPEVVTRKVLKVWDDEGFEDMRPGSVTVELLRDGEVYDTEELNEANLWRFTWENLPAEHEWLVVEDELEGYYTKVSLDGITFTVTNKYIVPLTIDDPPVVKKVTGDTPASAETFTFVFTSKSDANPMPEGSTGLTKEVNIVGGGSKEIGKITFTKPGTYVYTVAEKDTGAKGYIYDKTVYTITYTITQETDKLVVDRRVTDENGNEADYPVFTNQYKPPLPQTGVLWWPVPVLLSVGILFCILGTVKRRMRKDEE